MFCFMDLWHMTTMLTVLCRTLGCVELCYALWLTLRPFLQHDLHHKGNCIIEVKNKKGKLKMQH